jgi:hypothetical protein
VRQGPGERPGDALTPPDWQLELSLQYASSVVTHRSNSSDRPARAPKGINDLERQIADGGSSFARVLRHARRLRSIEERIRSRIDRDLADHFEVGALEDGALTLVSPSASWATRLRMQAPDIIRSLHSSGGEEIRKISVRVSPLSRRNPSPRRSRPLSPAARWAFDQFAELVKKND